MKRIRQLWFLILHLLLLKTTSTKSSQQPRANATIQIGISYDGSSDCDDSVFNMTICVGTFTDACQLFGRAVRYIQAACAANGPLEAVSFAVNDVRAPIHLDVTAQRIRSPTVHQLRRTEILLTDTREYEVYSFDLSFILRLQAYYVCFPNYYGKLCTTFCDRRAKEYECDEHGNKKCNTGYYMEPDTNSCRLDLCTEMPNYCQNSGRCSNYAAAGAVVPVCSCLPKYTGTRCEIVIPESTQVVTTTMASTTVATTSIETTLRSTKPPTLPPTTKSTTIATTVSKPTTTREVIHEIQREVKSRPALEELSPAVNHIDYHIAPSNLFDSETLWYKITILIAILVSLVFGFTIICFGLAFYVLRRKNTKKAHRHPLTKPPPEQLDISQTGKLWGPMGGTLNRYLSHEEPLPRGYHNPYYGGSHSVAAGDVGPPMDFSMYDDNLTGRLSVGNWENRFASMPRNFKAPQRLFLNDLHRHNSFLAPLPHDLCGESITRPSILADPDIFEESVPMLRSSIPMTSSNMNGISLVPSPCTDDNISIIPAIRGRPSSNFSHPRNTMATSPTREDSFHTSFSPIVSPNLGGIRVTPFPTSDNTASPLQSFLPTAPSPPSQYNYFSYPPPSVPPPPPPPPSQFADTLRN